MDSCHIFNFLFGTRRATTELSKCFSSTINEMTKRKKANNNVSIVENHCQSFETGRSQECSRPVKKSIVCVSNQDGGTTTTTTTTTTTSTTIDQSTLPPASPIKHIQMKLASLLSGSDKKQHFEVINDPNHYDESRISRESFQEFSSGTYRATLVESTSTATIELLDEAREGDDNHYGEDGKDEHTLLIDELKNDHNYKIEHTNGDLDGPSKSRPVSKHQMQLDQNLTNEELSTTSHAPKFCDLFHHQLDKTISSKNRVKNLVQSFEINTQEAEKTRKLSTDSSSAATPTTKTTTAIVKPLPQAHNKVNKQYQQPPKTPVKTKRAKCLNHQLSLKKPLRIEQLFQDEQFLVHFFDQLEPLDRCTAAQVCRSWRNILYSRKSYWKDLVSVIDCTQLRREHLVECIMNTLHQSAKSKRRANGHPSTDMNNNNNHTGVTTTNMANSKSSSIPSQISSTLSSVSISSLLSPLSESSRVDSIKERLYSSLDDRGFDAISLFGATDEDIEDLVCKSPAGAHRRILVGRLNNCCITDRGLDLFISTFNQIEELELSGCNEITNAIDLRALHNLRRLIITDCINMADGLAQRLIQIFHQLSELTIQAYHLTDAFLEFICLNTDTSGLKRLELPNCKEITDQSMLIIAKHFQQVEALSISGSTKITDDGVEILTEQAKQLRSLDLSWCTKITDASLECIACDLTSSLTELILDRNVHITDVGLGYLATMTNLRLLHIRWCPRVTDIGLETILTARTLKSISLAGLHQLTARSLLCLIEADQLTEIELTNCPAVNGELLRFLSSKLPKCNIIF